MAGSYICNLNDVQSVAFYRGSKEIELGQINDLLYSSLEKLIESNRGVVEQGRVLLESDILQRKELYFSVQDQVKNIRGLSAVFSFGGGKTESFEIKSRTNFKDTLTKKPNIAFLVGKNNHTLVLREARNYGDNYLVHSDAKSYFKKNYKGNVPLGEEERKNISEDNVFSVPEPQLILALEQIHEHLDIPRITPEIKVVGIGGDNLHYVRNSLLSVQDGHLDSDNFMLYEGTLNGLGLMDVLDAQYAHYCLNSKGGVINIDPDFFVYTPSLKHIDNYDWNNFKNQIRNVHSEISIDGKSNKLRRKVVEETQRKMNGYTLLDFLPENIPEAPILKSISTENSLN